MKLTSKGQVTIPLKFRKQFGLLPETEVVFEPAAGGVLVKPAAAGRRRRLQAAMRHSRGSASAGLSTDEIMRVTRGEA